VTLIDSAVLGRRPLVLRIGEVAKLTDLTTRTLRYWEELGLVAPSDYGKNGERLYVAADLARVARIRDLQQLMGFSLAEVRVVLDVEDVGVLDRVRSEFRSGDPSPLRQRELLDQAIVANDQLLVRLDETLARIQAFRTEREASAKRLLTRRADIDKQIRSSPSDRPSTKKGAKH
jgi:MerR family transcriptional regulator, repressor of the yfmOP operon